MNVRIYNEYQTTLFNSFLYLMALRQHYHVQWLMYKHSILIADGTY